MSQEFFAWMADHEDLCGRPWLVLGKGPSFRMYNELDTKEFRKLSLNHVVRETKVDIAHVIDLDVIDDCGETLLENADVVVMPWQPHKNNRPVNEGLDTLIEQNDTLKELNRRGKLVWYNLSTGASPRAGSPVVKVRYFSVEAAIRLLATAGVSVIRTLGVDGGRTYDAHFRDIADKTLLANGRRSFDQQFSEIADVVFTTKMDFAPLDLPSPVRVFVATTEAQMLATHVLEYSIRKNASMSVEFTPMHRADLEIPIPADPVNQPRTPFSFQRFLIPELTQYKGRAIYLDSDMQVFADIRRLWAYQFDGADVLTTWDPKDGGRKPQFSVMLLNCDVLEWNIRDIVRRLDSGELSYGDLMYDMRIASDIRTAIDPAWNSLERYSEGQTALLHYTDMQTQPWVFRNHPLGYLWMRDLIDAVQSGFITRDLVVEHVEQGWVRPSLLYQLDNRIEDSLLLPKLAKKLDKDFVAPYQSIHQHGATPWVSPASYARAIARAVYQKSGAARIRRAVRNRIDRG